MKKQTNMRKIVLGLLTVTILLGGYIAMDEPMTNLVAQEVSSESTEKLSSSSQTETTEENTVESDIPEETAITEGLSPLKDPRSLLMANSRASATTLDAREAELFADGWTTRVGSKNTALEIPIPGDDLGGRLRYFFGSTAMSGAKLPLSSVSNWATIRIPNVQYIYKGTNGNDIVEDHLYSIRYNDSSADTEAKVAVQFATQQGLIVANGSGSSSVLKLRPETARMYEKTAGGLTSIKLIYDASYFTANYNPELLVETTMTPLPTGKIKISQQVTNKSVTPQEGFMLGYTEDTQLVGEDNVPIYYVGDNRGVYIKSVGKSSSADAKSLKLTYLMSPLDIGNQAPQNWVGYQWNRFHTVTSTIKGDNFFNSTYTTFSNAYSTGQEIKNGLKDQQIISGIDSGVHMKNQPITFGSGESTGFSWTLGIDGMSAGPTVKLDKEHEDIEPNFGTYNVKGTWNDSEDNQTELFYRVNDGSFVSLGKKSNTTLGADVEFQIPLTNSQLNTGQNTVEVKLRNSAGKESTVKSMTINVKTKVDIKYVNSSNVAITPPAGSPTSLTGLVGEEFTIAIPTIDKYTFSINSSNVTKSGNNLIGKYTTATQTVTVTYKLTQTHGVANITYKDSEGNIITPPAGVNAPTSVTGLIGDTLKVDTPDMTPKYEISTITGTSIVSSDKKNFSVTFTEAAINIVLTYNINGKANVNYVDEGRNPITPPAGSPTELWGQVDTAKREAVPNFLPLYEISSVEGATLSGDKSSYLLVGFTKADQTITLVYKAIPQTVTMSVKYLMTGTTNGVIDLVSKDAVKEVTQTVVIGQSIAGYSDGHKKDIDGYNYKSVTGNTGNVPDKDFEVVYYYEGVLSLENVPDKVDFQNTNSLISFGTKDIYPRTPIQVGILDTRDSSNQSWELQLSVATPMQTASSQLLKGNLKINQGGNDLTLSSTKQVVRKQGTKSLGRENLTWGAASDKGLYLEQQPGNLKDVTYEGKLSWQLTDGL